MKRSLQGHLSSYRISEHILWFVFFSSFEKHKNKLNPRHFWNAHFLKSQKVNFLFRTMEWLNQKHISLEKCKYVLKFSVYIIHIFVFSGQSQFRVKRSNVGYFSTSGCGKTAIKRSFLKVFSCVFFAKYIKQNTAVIIEEIIYPKNYYLFRYVSKIRKIRDFWQNCRLDKQENEHRNGSW